MTNESLPPYDADAEEAVIGSLLIDSDTIFKVDNIVKPEDFFTQQNQLVYEACCDIYQRSEAINQITVAQELARRGRLEECGGAAYLSQLISMVPTSLHIEYYAQIVSRLATMRRLISAADQIAGIGYQADPDVDAALNKAEDVIFRVRKRQSQSDFMPINEVLNRYFEDILQTQPKGELAHILTGFNALDSILFGLQRSALIILAARPSVGKTSLALNIARNAAINQRACVAFFSLEMSQREIVQRLLASESNISSSHFRNPPLPELEEKLIMKAAGILSDAPMYIDDSPHLRMVEMRSKARRLHLKHKVDLIVLDYLQLMRGESRSENRVQELSEITRSLKALARELDVPVLVLSQLSRYIERRESHKPQLSDLRDSGSIEQDADVVFFIHREEMYFNEEEWEKRHIGDNEPYPKGIADILIAKNRNGPTDEVKLRFIAKATKFENLATELVSASQGV